MFLNPDIFIKTVNSNGCSSNQLQWLANSLLETNFPDDLMNVPDVSPFFMFSTTESTIAIFIHRPGGQFDGNFIYSDMYEVIKKLAH